MRRACVARAACALLWALACARAAAAAPTETGICQTMDIRNFPREMAKLRGCRVIEGQLSIVLMERAVPADFANISFPELREVTGYVKIYRMKGVRNLGDLFPNLSVVRGMQLFKDYAIVIFDSENIEMLGLRSLTTVERGAVRIQNNDRLCYANTIDWNRIIQDEGAASNMIRSNYDTRLCGLCPNAQSRMEDHRQPKQCPADSSGRLLCWDDKHCQKVCPLSCPGACMSDGTCCHKECLGGCDGLAAKDCHVCKHFSLGYGANRTCTRHCPAGFYELFRRCVTEHDCRQTPPPVSIGRPEANPPRVQAYKILNNVSCVWTCPSGYMEVGDKWSSTCQPCPESGCVRECPGGKIDSIGSLELFRGCTHIKGTIEISLRASGGNTMAALEAALGEIRVITGGLKVTRSNPLVSLMFFKSLERISATDHENKGQSLHIFNNPNLELLWDWKNHKPIKVDGRLYIHFNPKLCYALIEPLKRIMNRNFTDTEVSEENNGDQASCFQDTLHVKVHEVRNTVVILTWDMYCMEDARKLLGYSVYYIVAEQNVTLYGQRDACSDSWSVLDYTMDDVRRNASSPDSEVTDKLELFTNPCHRVQPLFYPVTQLTPFTRYAAYVKTFTTLQDKKGAQSPIIYFKTLPGRPSPPQSLTVEPLDAHQVYIKWLPPAKPNGTIITYRVEIQANAYNRETIVAGNNNYCSDPNALSNLIASRPDDAPEREEVSTLVEQRNASTCACRDEQEAAKGSRFSAQAEEERWESIQFENELQNQVYIKTDRSRIKNIPRSQNITRPRSKRSIADPESKLVILSEHHTPVLGENYTNITEGGFVKSQFYELDGTTHAVTVTNMRHFTWYTVNVWACRERQRNESDDAYEKTWCSSRAYYTFRTSKLRSLNNGTTPLLVNGWNTPSSILCKQNIVPKCIQFQMHPYNVTSDLFGNFVQMLLKLAALVNADIVFNVFAMKVPSNKTFDEVNVTWSPPRDPNGFVVAYNVHYSRVDDSSQSRDVGVQSCIIASECNRSCTTVLRNLLPGNYSVRVTPITVSGAGNASAPAYAFIAEKPSGTDWLWGVVGGCVVMSLVLGGAIWYARRGLLPATEANKLFASVNPEYVSTVYVPDEWEVPRANVEFIKELGQGSFGMVYEGLVKDIEKGKAETRCAVKTVNEHATDRERVEFLNEASVMKAFDTHHVVRLLGVVSRGQPTLVIMELMESGDLKTYLRSHRPDADNSLPRKEGAIPPTPPTLQNILQMAIEIADGMAYLSAKKFVHRDLAARNCMVAGDLTVKVGDFGMTRDIYETDYYRKGSKGLLPVRWMSPESLKDGVFSSNSDVWSYGVVLWEMATLAMQPYQGLSNEQVLRYVVEGGVMERPEHCPDRLYELMRACWAHRPSQRPSFLQLVADLAPTAQPHFRHRSFFHTPQGQEIYALQRSNTEEEPEMPEVNVGAVATGSGSNLFGVSGRLASWVRELSSLRSRGDDDAAAEPLQPPAADNVRPIALKTGPNGVIRDDREASENTGC